MPTSKEQQSRPTQHSWYALHGRSLHIWHCCSSSVIPPCTFMHIYTAACILLPALPPACRCRCPYSSPTCGKRWQCCNGCATKIAISTVRQGTNRPLHRCVGAATALPTMCAALTAPGQHMLHIAVVPQGCRKPCIAIVLRSTQQLLGGCYKDSRSCALQHFALVVLCCCECELHDCLNTACL